MSGIEFFLTRQIQAAEYHPKGWLWYLLDREGLQQDILQVLFNESPQFSQSLLGLSGPCVCVRQPRNGSFDLMVQSKSTAGEAVYLEIKVDQKWETAQQNKQITFLRESKARGVLVLFSQRAALLPKSDVTRFSGGLFSKVSYAEIYRALDSITSSEDRPELREFAAAYGLALRQQEERTRKDDWGDPNS